MKYMLILWDSVTYWDEKGEEEQAADVEEHIGFSRWLREQGMFVAGEGLLGPATATTVRKQGGETVISDGPYLDLNETLGGFYVIDVPNLETALEVAGRCPVSALELRPVWE